MASAILKPGTTVGNRYRIDLLLGGGESCPTYRCRDQANGDAPVALKVLADRDGAEGIARLRRELSILSRVKHPHLVHHTDFGVIHRGRTPYLVRPFITGQDIYLSSADWSVELILDQLAEIGRVLQFLHSRGLVFRHLKPANIILTCGATSPITARLLDFGLDRPMRRGRNEPLPHAYAAPEVLLGHLGNSRSDLYSFGILAYQLLGRRLPFDDDDVGYLVQKQLQGRADMRPIERLKGGAGLAQVILCLLEKDPEKRPSSADDMVRLLSAASGRDYSGSVSGATEAYFSSGCFVGREKEMEFLQDRAQRVRETGRGHTVFLAGEGGAGKSRLFEELRTWALLDNWRVVEAGCLQREDRSYGPYRRILAQMELMQPEGAGSNDARPIFRFDDPIRSDKPPQFELSSGSAAGPFRDQLTRELVRLLSDRPTLLLLHDFHWADEAVITVLDYLTSDIQAHPIFLCVSLRPGESEPGLLSRLLEMSVRHQRAESLMLEVLPPAAAEEMIAGITGEKELAGEIAPWAHKASGGNPFFIEEILKHLVDRKLLRRESGKWRLEMEGFANLQVPSSVASVLRQRLEQLTPGGKEIASWLALVNHAAPKEQVRDLCKAASEVVEAHLRELLSRQIIVETSGGFEFRHALISELIAENLAAAERRRMHRQIAELLEKHGGGRDHLQELALHLVEGSGGAKSVQYVLLAARSCKAEFANELALRFYEYLIRHRRHLSRDQVGEIAIEAADTCCALGNPRRAIRILQTQLQQNRRGTPLLSVRLYTQLSRAYQYLGEMKQSKRSAKCGLEILKSKKAITQIEEVEAALYSQSAFCMLAESKPRQGLALLKRSLDLQNKAMSTIAIGHSYILISALCGVACEFANGVKASRMAISALEPHKAYHLLPMAYSHLGICLAGLGKLGRSIIQFKHSLDTGEKTRSPFLLIQALCNLSECYCRMGQYELAIQNSSKATLIASTTENRNLLAAAILCRLETLIATANWKAAQNERKLLTIRDIDSMPVYLSARALYLSALLSVELGNFSEAIPELFKLAQLESRETPIYEANQGELLKAIILFREGDLWAARDSLLRLRSTAIGNRRAYQTALIVYELAAVLIKFENWQEASYNVNIALKLAIAMPAFHLQAKAHYFLGKIAVLRAEQAIGTGQTEDAAGLPNSDALMETALSELNQALDLAKAPEMIDTGWRVHHMMMRLFQLKGDKETALHHAQESLRLLALVESRVPADMLDVFRNVEERGQAKAECQSAARRHYAGSDGSFLTVGEMEGEHLRILCQASGAINSIRDIDPLMEAICRFISRALQMERALAVLWDEKAGVLRPAGQINMKIHSLDDLDCLSVQVLRDVFHAGSPIVSAAVRSDPRLGAKDGDFYASSLFCGPLASCGRILGILYVDSRQTVENLTASTINLFAAFCNMAAVAIENALAHRHLIEEKTELERYLRQAKGDYSEIVGKSESIRMLRERIRLAADSPLDILIGGESGTGKELVARALHRTGRRSAGRFVALDCGSLSDSLVESELFGYRKGAFTGAMENRPGLFEAAEGGVIFLDEISSLSMRLQRKILRVLQEREVRRVGETSPRKINVQVIAATNRNLRQDVQAGRFRGDLYFRLNAMEISVPPLREHREDVPLLLEWFLDKTGRNEGGRTKTFCREARALLENYPWPGNVRELKNVVEGSYYSTPGSIIEAAHIPAAVRDGEGEIGVWEPAPAAWQVYKTIRDGLGGFDDLVKTPFLKRQIGCGQIRQLLHLALAETAGRYRDAFRLLGIPEREYAIVMQFLKRNGCYLDFRPYRKPGNTAG